MVKALENVSFEERWATATKALTGATHQESQALINALGQEKYDEVITEIWGEQGKVCKEIVESLGLKVDSPKSAAEASEAVVTLLMGPEFKLEVAEDTPDRVVCKCTECPWWNRQQEMNLKGNLCTKADPAFFDALAKSLNPKLNVTLTKAMPKGDSFCEWIYEVKK